MRNIDIYEIYRDKSLIEKIVEYGQAVKQMEWCSSEAFMHSCRGNSENAEYYRAEYQAMRRRANGLMWLIRRELGLNNTEFFE